MDDSKEILKRATEAAMFLADRLNDVGIKTEVVSQEDAWEVYKNERGVNFSIEFRLADGMIYGYQQGDTIYLTPAGINPNTPIHEYAHIWANAYEKLQPERWQQLKSSLKELSLWETIANSEEYSHLLTDEDRLAGEVLATIVGNKGEQMLIDAARDSENVEDTIASFREKITSFALENVFGLKSASEYENITLGVLNDFVEGRNPNISLQYLDGREPNASLQRNTVQDMNTKDEPVMENRQPVHFQMVTKIPPTIKMYKPKQLDFYSLKGVKQFTGDILTRIRMATSIEDLENLRNELEAKGILINGHSFTIDRKNGVFVYTESDSGRKAQPFVISYKASKGESKSKAEAAALSLMKEGLSSVVHTLSVDVDQHIALAEESFATKKARTTKFFKHLFNPVWWMIWAIMLNPIVLIPYLIYRGVRDRGQYASPPRKFRTKSPMEVYDNKRKRLQRSLEKALEIRKELDENRAKEKSNEDEAKPKEEAEELHEKNNVKENDENLAEELENDYSNEYIDTGVAEEQEMTEEAEEAERAEEQSESAFTSEEIAERREAAARRLSAAGRGIDPDQAQESVIEGNDIVSCDLSSVKNEAQFKAMLEMAEEKSNEGKIIVDKTLGVITDFSISQAQYQGQVIAMRETEFKASLMSLFRDIDTIHEMEGILGEKNPAVSFDINEINTRLNLCSSEKDRAALLRDYKENVRMRLETLESKYIGMSNSISNKEPISHEIRDLSKEDQKNIVNAACKEAFANLAGLEHPSNALAQNVNGNLYLGASQVILQADMAQRGVSPIYLTQEQIADYGLSVQGNGVQIFQNDGKGNLQASMVYNLSDTDFSTKMPKEVVSKVMDKIDSLQEIVDKQNTSLVIKKRASERFDTAQKVAAAEALDNLIGASVSWGKKANDDFSFDEAREDYDATVKSSISSASTYFDAANVVAEKLLSTRAAKKSTRTSKSTDFETIIKDSLKEQEAQKGKEVEVNEGLDSGMGLSAGQ